MQLRKLFIAVAGLGLSCSAFALTPLAVNGFNNPNSCTNWIFGAAGDYLQPLGNDLDYANLVNESVVYPPYSASSSSPVISSTEINEQAVDPDFDWGWQGMIDYRFPQTTNDVELSYQHFNSSDDDNVTAGPTSYQNGYGNYAGSAVFPAGTSVPFHTVEGDLDNKFDAVNLDFGHTFNDGRLGIRVDGGLQWARIASDYDVFGSGDFNTLEQYPPTVAGVFQTESTFHGIGPSASLGANFDLGNGVMIYADGRVVLLVGDIDSESNSAYSFAANPEDHCTPPDYINNASFNGESQTTVVPGGDAEAGLSYTAPLGNNVALTVQAGYMVAGYVHPIRRVWVDPGSGFNTSSSFESTLSDFGLQGPYIGADINF